MLELLELRICTLDQMSILNIALFATSLIMLLLLAYVSVPVDGLPYIPHLRDLIQNLAINRRIPPSELIDTAGALYDTAVQQSANPGPNPFPGLSQATPGTFERMILRHYLKILSRATTPST